jgi:hypothetical protein
VLARHGALRLARHGARVIKSFEDDDDNNNNSISRSKQESLNANYGTKKPAQSSFVVESVLQNQFSKKIWKGIEKTKKMNPI